MSGRTASAGGSPKSSRTRRRQGQGKILAAGFKPLRVAYDLTVDRLHGQTRVLGSLRGNAKALHAAWLLPLVTLRLENGERIAVSITELTDAAALIAQAF